MIGVVKRAHAAYRPHPIRAADLYNGNLSASILRIKSKPQPRARSLIADEATVRLTRFRGRLTRPKFGVEVAHEVQQEGRSNRAA
jgi:hypothetical protein